MTTAAIELCDAALVLARGASLVDAGSGYAALVDGRLVFGEAARPVLRLDPRRVQRGYWQSLSEAPLPQPLGQAATAADLVHAQLEALWARREGATAAVLAVPGGWSHAQLGLLLGIAQEIGMPVAGIVDAAVAASRSPVPGRALWHVVAGLQRTVVSRIGQDAGAARLDARHVVDRFGLESLERAAAEHVARRFVECSRFDPLHQARSEQLLLDELPGWLAQLVRVDRLDVALGHGGHRYEATLEMAGLRAAIARVAEPLTRLLRSLLPPREAAVLQVHDRLAAFPGVIDALLTLPAGGIVQLEPGAAARGALRLRAAPADSHVLGTALPFDRPPLDEAALPPPPAARLPTHLVAGERAWRLGARPLQVGTEPGEGSYGLRLAGSAISRRHCTIGLEDGRIVLHDQSRYGTLLNGHPVAGAAVLQAGDVIGVGQPPQWLTVVAEATDAP